MKWFKKKDERPVLTDGPYSDSELDDLVTWALKEQRRRAMADWDCDERLDEDEKRTIGDEKLEAYLVGKKIKVECHERPGVTYWIRWKEVSGVVIDEWGIMAVQLVEDEPGSNWHCVGFSTPIYVRN